MKFDPSFDILARIQLLERWILVQSFIYYVLDDNVSSDFNYDDNVKELFALRESHPDDYARSRYYLYFENYEPGCTSGFELLEKVRKNDSELYRHLHMDAILAINMKQQRSK